jgi:hypothetical protein
MLAARTLAARPCREGPEQFHTNAVRTSSSAIRSRGNQPLQRVRDALRFEAEWTGPSLVRHPPFAINHIQPVGPARVVPFRGVVEAIHDGRKMNPQFHHAQLSHLAALVNIFRARENDVIIQIVWVLPHVAGMCFAYVHHVERRLILILFVQLVQSGNLPPERRSGVAAENQHHRFLAAHGRQLKRALVVRTLQ